MGDIEFSVPNSWVVSETEGAVEIVDASKTGAMHFSFLKRSLNCQPNEADARSLIENFAFNNGLVADAAISSSSRASETRAIGFFHPDTPTSETPLHWLLGSIVYLESAIRVSYCADLVSDETVALVFSILDSIHRRK